MTWDYEALLRSIDLLVKPGLIGTYRSFEVTELVRLPEKDAATQQAVNVLTVAVADSRDATSGEKVFLSKFPLALKGTSWKFGLARYRLSIAQLREAVDRFAKSHVWHPGSDNISVGDLVPLPPQFVCSDAMEANPLNTVLRNNFWNGSHLLELFDRDKDDLGGLIDVPHRQSALSALIRPFVPWGLDALTDRLGNVLIQLPITALVSGVRGSASGEYIVTSAWQPGTAARPLRLSAEVYRHGVLEGIDSSVMTEGTVKLALHSNEGGARHTLWDEQNLVLLDASAETHFVRGIHASLNIKSNDEVREFTRQGSDGSFVLERVDVIQAQAPIVIGDANSDPRTQWRARRALRQSLSKLQQEREFVQYGGVSGAGREQALEDIRMLIVRHGRVGAWLWDPYLSGKDLLDTLFFSPHADSDLRGLTASEDPPVMKSRSYDPQLGTGEWNSGEANVNNDESGEEAGTSSAEPTRRQAFLAKQIADLEASKGNLRGMKLEYRSREGDGGWSFHDRFLIFPRDDGPALAWSLGTSVNSLGRQHHILQKVADGDLIRRAFEELWNELTLPKHLIWKVS